MTTFNVTHKCEVIVSRNVEAKSFAEAEEKSKDFKFSQYLKVAPGTELCDWTYDGINWISKGD